MPGSFKTPVLCGIFILLLIWIRVVTGAESQTVEVITEKLILRFDVKIAQPVMWKACAPSCSSTRKITMDFTAPEIKPSVWTPVEAHKLLRALEKSSYTFRRTQSATSVLVEFISEPIDQFGVIKKSYAISKTHYEVVISIERLNSVDGKLHQSNAVKLDLTVGEHFVQRQSSGFASLYERARTLVFDGREVKEIAEAGDDNGEVMLTESYWVGIRNRFWTVLLQAKQVGARAREFPAEDGLPRLSVEVATNQSVPLSYKVYSGPIAYDALQRTSRDLPRLLFAGLWWWLRLLCLGLMFILSGLYAIIGNYGLAIIALALVVKLLMSPLTALAEKWQHEVNAKRSVMQPLIDEVKANYKGEEQVNRILKVYKAHDTHMLFSLKSMFGFLIQIPIFIAAFDMLSENFALNAVSFLWIEDLAKPDHFLKLPFSIPFFGTYINLLPFIMTFITVLASLQFEAHTLSPQLRKQQQRHLYIMAALFFVLFYTFPAGMVLYWTSTNFWQFLRDQISKRRRENKAHIQ